MTTLNNVLKAIEALKSAQESNTLLSDSNARYKNKFLSFNNENDFMNTITKKINKLNRLFLFIFNLYLNTYDKTLYT